MGFFSGIEEIRRLWRERVTYKPGVSDQERNEAYRQWNRAVERTYDWAEEDSPGQR